MLLGKQGKEAVKDAVYREALKQTPNGFYRRQLYVLEVNLRQQQTMWVDLHHSIFYKVRLCLSSCFICNAAAAAAAAAAATAAAADAAALADHAADSGADAWSAVFAAAAATAAVLLLMCTMLMQSCCCYCC